MSLIKIEDLTFAYEGSYENIFEHVSFQIDTDWKLGFTGRNGRGKTTFLRLLQGLYEYRGHISASVGFDYFPFVVEDKTLPTGELLAAIAPEAAHWQIEREISLLKITPDALERPFATLSNGEQTKALLAALFLKENNFLLVDEPTNHLDLAGRKLTSDYLRSKKGFLLVSHDRAFLDNCVDHILAINKTQIEVQRGNFSSWWENKERREAFERATHERLEHEIKQLTDNVKRTSRWSDQVEKTKFGNRDASGIKPDKGYIGAKSAKMMKRSKATAMRRERALEEKEGLLQDLEQAEALFMRPQKHHARILAEAQDLVIAYDERQILGPLNLSIEQGERLALAGPNGCGKSSLIKLLCGQDIPHTGGLRLASGLIISYLPQDTSFLQGPLRPWVRAQGLDESRYLTMLRKLDFERSHFEKNMQEMSAGQKKKLLLAASLANPAHLYIWDEPLNYIDVLSRIQIEEVILEYQPTLLFVEHDAAFIEHVATRRVDL